MVGFARIFLHNSYLNVDSTFSAVAVLFSALLLKGVPDNFPVYRG